MTFVLVRAYRDRAAKLIFKAVNRKRIEVASLDETVLFSAPALDVYEFDEEIFSAINEQPDGKERSKIWERANLFVPGATP